ncbi:MAG TPA: hypothetical protein VN578_03930 [Candidatus Binatia bacterium]|nr:hypothetical protein [Candidatus Binatia bacterium]
MNKLSKEKRQQLVLVVLLTTGALVGLYFGLVRFQQRSLTELQKRKLAAKQELELVKRTIASADQIEAQVGDASARLAKLEEGMAAGDLYAWAFNTVRQFKHSYKVEIPQLSQVDGPREMTLLPQFPYKQASVTIGGTAFFYDLGKFIADFENQFPYFRVVNLSMEPISALAGADKEKLSFRLEIAALVKPGTS